MNDPNAKQRLFFALWPSPSLQERFYALARDVNGGRRVPAQNLHVTLAFLDSVDRACRTCVEQGAEQVRIAAFELTLDRLDCFRRRGLFWAGSSEVPAALGELAAALARVQASCGLVPERREYRPHVTLIRDLARCPLPGAIEPIVWPVREFSLVSSVPTPTGSCYEIVRAWTLR